MEMVTVLSRSMNSSCVGYSCAGNTGKRWFALCISGLVAAGGLAAAMSTADGLLLAIANALSDLYYDIDPKADTKTRLVVAALCW